MAIFRHSPPGFSWAQHSQEPFVFPRSCFCSGPAPQRISDRLSCHYHSRPGAGVTGLWHSGQLNRVVPSLRFPNPRWTMTYKSLLCCANSATSHQLIASSFCSLQNTGNSKDDNADVFLVTRSRCLLLYFSIRVLEKHSERTKSPKKTT